ncbi:MAG: hypothetical protein WB608_24615 [Terracidiphilus sp.]
MSSTHVFGVRAYGCNIQMESPSLEAHLVLEQYILPSLPRMDIAADVPHIVVRVTEVDGQFQVFVGDQVVASASSAIGMVPPLIKVLDDAVIERLTMLRAIHAGAVVWNQRALLLPGATHAGKSSLVAELLRRGATYFSDEFALIDAQGFVHPYPRPLLLRNGRPIQSPVLPQEFNVPVGDAPAPVGWIFSLEYVPGTTWNVSSLPHGEAVLTLLKNTPHYLAELPDLVEVFQSAVAGAICFSGQRDEAVPAVDHILQLVESHS